MPAEALAQAGRSISVVYMFWEHEGRVRFPAPRPVGIIKVMMNFLSRINIPLSRFVIFFVYFGFGLLKVIGESPASQLVKELYDKTIGTQVPSLEFAQFFLAFGLFEVVIGILFLMPRMGRVSFPMVLIHLVTTAGPLFLLPGSVWVKTLVPTLEGQYIIKNILILALALNIKVNSR